MPSDRQRKRPGFVGGIRRLATVISLLLVLLIAAAWWASRPATPDAFYDPPAQPPAEAGALLRSEPYTRDVPAGARAWRILYTTTRIDNAPTVASAIVVAPAQDAGAPRPVIAWAHGTTGIVPGCAPSLMAPFDNVPAFDKVAGEGWAYVAADYVGLGTRGGHAYLIGDDAARAVLDAVRAVRQLQGLTLDNRVVVWGHSQGGNSALWTGMRAQAYAPDVNVAGVAALAPATDLAALFSGNRSSMFGKIVSSLLVKAYSATYRDLDEAALVHGRARLIAADIASRCVGGVGTLFSVLETRLLPRDGIFIADPATGALGARLQQNTPTAPIAAPVLIGQGQADDVVLPALQGRYVADRCAAGQPIDYRTYAGRDHVSLVALDSPASADLVAWTRDRLAGRPAASTCGR